MLGVFFRVFQFRLGPVDDAFKLFLRHRRFIAGCLPFGFLDYPFKKHQLIDGLLDRPPNGNQVGCYCRHVGDFSKFLALIVERRNHAIRIRLIDRCIWQIGYWRGRIGEAGFPVQQSGLPDAQRVHFLCHLAFDLENGGLAVFDNAGGDLNRAIDAVRTNQFNIRTGGRIRFQQNG